MNTSVSDYPYIRFNSDSGGNYSQVAAEGYGSTVNSRSISAQTSGYIILDVGTTIGYNAGTLDVLDYSATDKHKTALARCGGSGSGVEMNAIRWASTAAVTALSITAQNGLFLAGSTFTLYGVSA